MLQQLEGFSLDAIALEQRGFRDIVTFKVVEKGRDPPIVEASTFDQPPNAGPRAGWGNLFLSPVRLCQAVDNDEAGMGQGKSADIQTASERNGTRRRGRRLDLLSLVVGGVWLSDEAHRLGRRRSFSIFRVVLPTFALVALAVVVITSITSITTGAIPCV